MSERSISTAGLEPDRASQQEPPLITRRNFLHTAGAVATVAAGAGLFNRLDSDARPGVRGREHALSNAVSATKTIVVVDNSEPASIDPIKYNSHLFQCVTTQMVESLLKWTNHKTIEPLLAAAMPVVSADGLTYTVKLRPGVKFHNGKTLDSSDVKYTFEQCTKPSNGSLWGPKLALVESVKTPDTSTVVIHLKSPYTPLLNVLTLIPIIPSNIAYGPKTYSRSLVGTGPFKFVKWESGVQIVLAANPDYWQTGLPKSAGITFRFITSDSARIAALLNGTAQEMPWVSPNEVSLMRRRGITVDVLESSSDICYMYPNVASGKATADLNLRQAIAWAIDRERIVKDVFYGYAVPDCTLPANGAQYYNVAIGQSIHLDKARAKTYLQKAGGPPKKPLTFIAQASTTASDVAEIVQENLTAIGIPTTLSVLDVAAALSKLASGDYDLFYLDVSYQESTGFGADIAYSAVTPGSPGNFNHFYDPKIYQLAKKAVSVPDGPEAKAAWAAVQKRWVEVLPQINIVTARFIEANKHLSGYEPSELAMLENLKYASVV